MITYGEAITLCVMAVVLSILLICLGFFLGRFTTGKIDDLLPKIEIRREKKKPAVIEDPYHEAMFGGPDINQRIPTVE